MLTHFFCCLLVSSPCTVLRSMRSRRWNYHRCPTRTDLQVGANKRVTVRFFNLVDKHNASFQSCILFNVGIYIIATFFFCHRSLSSSWMFLMFFFFFFFFRHGVRGVYDLIDEPFQNMADWKSLTERVVPGYCRKFGRCSYNSQCCLKRKSGAHSKSCQPVGSVVSGCSMAVRVNRIEFHTCSKDKMEVSASRELIKNCGKRWKQVDCYWKLSCLRTSFPWHVSSRSPYRDGCGCRCFSPRCSARADHVAVRQHFRRVESGTARAAALPLKKW